jgi:hypothetical protein
VRETTTASLTALVGCLVLTPGLLAAPKQAPARLAHARYVALGYDLGDRFLSDQEAIGHGDRVLPEDRRALNAIQDLIKEWGRYTVTVRPDQAELLIAIRTGRRAVAEVSPPVSGGRGGRVLPGPTFGGEISSTDDMLLVYESAGGRPGTLFWRETRTGGLSGSPPPLFESFKSAVERIPKP